MTTLKSYLSKKRHWLLSHGNNILNIGAGITVFGFFMRTVLLFIPFSGNNEMFVRIGAYISIVGGFILLFGAMFFLPNKDTTGRIQEQIDEEKDVTTDIDEK